MASSVQPRGTCGHVKSPWDDHRQCLACCSCTRFKPCKVSEVWSSETWNASECRRTYDHRSKGSRHSAASTPVAHRKSSPSPSQLGRSTAPSRDRDIQANTSVSTVTVAPTSESTGTSDPSLSALRNKHVPSTEKKKSLDSKPKSASVLTKLPKADSSTRQSRSDHPKRKEPSSTAKIIPKTKTSENKHSNREASKSHVSPVLPSAKSRPVSFEDTDKTSQTLLNQEVQEVESLGKASQVPIGGILETYVRGSKSLPDPLGRALDSPQGVEFIELEFEFDDGLPFEHRAPDLYANRLQSPAHRVPGLEYPVPGTGYYQKIPGPGHRASMILIWISSTRWMPSVTR